MLPSNGDKTQAKQITMGRNVFTDTTGISWTPDGRIVYGSNAGGKWGIWKIDTDGQNAVQLTLDCAGNDTCSEPIASPDGRYIVFQAKRDGIRNIWRMESDGINPTQITFDGGAYPSLTNDGSSVIYVQSGQPVSTLQQVPIDGGEKTRFSPIDSAASVAFTSDGQRMAFGYYDTKSKDPWKTCVAPVNADSPEKCFGISRSYPRWSADGKSFYYLDHDYRGIWKQFLDGRRSMFLEFPGERTNNFVFSPDGKSLVVARSKQTQDVVSIIDDSR
jgi:Tol biopolymer transport system component